MPEAEHPFFARLWSGVLVGGLERAGAGRYRQELLSGLAGEVLEVGAGTGVNFPRYPSTVTRLVAIEPEPHLRKQAAAAGAGLSFPVEVLPGLAGSLPLPDASVDAVVCCLVLCSVDDLGAALAEAARVLRPGGELRLLEHVLAPEPGAMRRIQRGLDATVWPRLFGGCHVSRDTVAAVEHVGFVFESLERFGFPRGARGPAAFAVLGRAVLGRPPSDASVPAHEQL